ncbi:hypothetical protein [Kineothrix sp. MB12-C1]|nr:hypothetical protein [Kineothrix sp. MB12-C1]WMC92039.1 hypothetical protein RBB56_14395 [Kineothrix sp. MB12-C1]
MKEEYRNPMHHIIGALKGYSTEYINFAIHELKDRKELMYSFETERN